MHGPVIAMHSADSCLLASSSLLVGFCLFSVSGLRACCLCCSVKPLSSLGSYALLSVLASHTFAFCSFSPLQLSSGLASQDAFPDTFRDQYAWVVHQLELTNQTLEPVLHRLRIRVRAESWACSGSFASMRAVPSLFFCLSCGVSLTLSFALHSVGE